VWHCFVAQFSRLHLHLSAALQDRCRSLPILALRSLLAADSDDELTSLEGWLAETWSAVARFVVASDWVRVASYHLIDFA
jgi:hypothetical protein